MKMVLQITILQVGMENKMF